MAKGTAHKLAVERIDHVLTLKHFRPETAHRAVGAVLTYMGARRVRASCASGDRDLLDALAQIEDAAIRLDAVPQRVEFARERGEVWQEIIVDLKYVKSVLDAERRAIRRRVEQDLKRAASG